MSTRTRVGAVVGTAVVLGLLFVLAQGSSAGDEKALADKILKLADQLAKGDAAGAKKGAEALAKTTELEDVMHLFKPRKKKGLGVGRVPGVVTPDGIEQKLIALGRDEPSPATLNKEAGALVEASHVTEVIAYFTAVKPNDKGAKKITEWKKYAKEMREGAAGLAAAAKSKSSAAVKDAATKLNAACNSCHSAFRE